MVKVGKLLLFDEFLLLLLVLINAECDSSDLALPLLGVSGHHLLDSRDGNVAILAPGSPEVDEHDLTLLGSDGALSDSGIFRGILKFSKFRANLSPAEDVNVHGAESHRRGEVGKP